MLNLLKFQKQINAMVDIETLSTNYNAVVVSIGAVRFKCADKKIFDSFKVNIDYSDAKKNGLVISKETVEWWSKQKPEAIKGWKTNQIPLKEAMNSFYEWWQVEPNQNFWCQGLSFDSPILQSNFKAVGLKKPWHHHQEYDSRTVFNMIGVENHVMREKEKEVYHDSLGDAIAQAKRVLEYFGYEDVPF